MKGRDDKLCYLDASKLVSSVGTLSHVDLRGTDDRVLGVLDGIVIDPTERRLRYFVVESTGWLRRKRFLLPADGAARVDNDLGELRLEVDSEDLSGCEEFKTGSVRDFSDDDLIAGLFNARVQ
jgi:hypothetical protein